MTTAVELPFPELGGRLRPGVADMKDDRSVANCVDNPVLDRVRVLLDAFRRHEIRYCYWKSSRRVHEVLAGEADLDLLIAREDRHRAQSIALECGFKLCPSVSNQDHPAIASFLGYDEPSGRIVHLHAHFRLVVGEKLLKSYRLPWEEALLADAIPHPTLSLRMLDPASEALLLAVRACLELRWDDPVALRNWRAVQRKFSLDRAELLARLDRAMLRSRAAEFMEPDLAQALSDAFFGEQPLENQARLRRRVRKSLAAHRTYNAAEAYLRGTGRAVLWLAGGLNERFLYLPRPWRRRAPGGGSVVAVLGVDGSGKSTVVSAMRAWLGPEVDTLPVYLGTGDGRPSLLLLPLKLLVPLVTPLVKTKPRGASHGKVSDRPPGPLYSGSLMIWATVLAVEKRVKLLAARRAASRGLMVITDRYAQDQIVEFNDGPLLPRLTMAPQWLRRFEAGAYALARRLPPDLVIKLVAAPETLAMREPTMDRAVIAERLAALRRLTFPGSRVVCVDAEQPLADVLRAVRHEIWHLV